MNSIDIISTKFCNNSELDQNKVEVLVYLNWGNNQEKEDEILYIFSNLSASEFALKVIECFGEKIKKKGYKFIYIQKFHKKFDRFVTLKLNETNFLFDGAIFEVFPSLSHEQDQTHFEINNKNKTLLIQNFSNNKNKTYKLLQSEKKNDNSSSLEIFDLEYPQSISSKFKNVANINKFIITDSKKPYLTSNHSKLSLYYYQQSSPKVNATSSDSSLTSNRKTKRDSVKPLLTYKKQKEASILISPKREKLHSYLLRQKSCSYSPQNHINFKSSSRCKEKFKKSYDFIPQQKFSKLSKHLIKLNKKSENLNRSHFPLNQLDNTWNHRFFVHDVLLSDEEINFNSSSDCGKLLKHHTNKRSTEKNIHQKFSHTEKSENLKNNDLVENVKIRRPSLLPAPATLEEHIDKLLGRCRMERNPSKQSSLISEILSMYKILGNTFETIKKEFDQKIGLSDRRFLGYDFKFADNFEDFWSYGILEYCKTSVIDDKFVLKCIIDLKICENVWELNSEDRCSKAFQLIGAFCSPFSILMLQRILYDVSSKNELENCVKKTEWCSPRIICFNGKYYLAVCGQLISLNGSLPDAMALYIILHFYFSLNFPEECREILYIVTVLMGLPLPARTSLNLRQMNFLLGTFDLIQKNSDKFNKLKFMNFKWSPILIHNNAPIQTSSTNKSYLIDLSKSLTINNNSLSKIKIDSSREIASSTKKFGCSY